MKKLLLTTTTLGALVAGTAFAEGPTVTIGGFADFQVGIADQEEFFESQSDIGTHVFADGRNETDFTSDTHSRTDTELHINIDGKADNGLGYGAHIELEADVNSDDSTNANNNAEQGYIYVESGFGRVEVGPTGDAGNALRVDASTFARATGGIGGDFYKYVDLGSNAVAGANTGEYFILPGLPTAVGLPGEANIDATGNDIHNARATANKISYYSPRIQGVQLGVSYTPDQAERGTQAGFSGSRDQSIRNVWNAGLNYQGQFDQIGIEASATGEIGTTEHNTNTGTTNLDDLEAYALGLNVSYAGFTVGGSWGTADEIAQVKTTNQSVDYWTLGAAYEFGPFATSVTYMDSTVNNASGAANTLDNEFTNLSIGADYQLAPGLVPYVEVSFFETDNQTPATATATSNEGNVVIVGTGLSF